MISKETRNVIQLGVGMFFVFFAFVTQGFIVQTVLENRHKTDPRISKEAGYYSQTIIYGAFIFSTAVSPVVVALITPKWSLVLGSSGYTLYMLGFTFLNPYYLYISAAWEGLCAGALWTGMGQYLTLNSNPRTMTRNSGLVWFLNCLSTVAGGVFLLIMFKNYNTDNIDMKTTRILYGTFTGLALAGNICFALLPQVKDETEQSIEFYWNEFRSAVYLLPKPKTMLLMFAFAYSGIELSFWSGVYSNSLSNTKSFPINNNILIALNQISVGVGEIVAAISVWGLGWYTTNVRRYLVIMVGAAAGISAYTISFLMLPGDSPFEETNKTTYIQPNEFIALLGGFLLGAADSYLNTEIYSIVPALFADRTAQAFAVHKFFHAILTTACMFYGSVLLIQYQLLILAITAIASTFTYMIAEILYDKPSYYLEKVIQLQNEDEKTDSSHL